MKVVLLSISLTLLQGCSPVIICEEGDYRVRVEPTVTIALCKDGIYDPI